MNFKRSIMKKITNLTGFLLVCLVALPPGLNAQVQSSQGLKLVANGDLKLVFNDAGLINHGQFSPGNSTVIFKGTAPSYISGSSAVNFHNLVISKTGQDLSLDNDLNISGNLRLEEGNLQLNSRTLDLGYTGRIEGERNEARITGSPGGIIKAYALLNAPKANNPGNMGVEITSAAAMGETEIIRGHSAQLSAEGQPVIARYYDIKPGFNTNLRATLKFYYLDAELNNGKEEALTVFASKKINGTWMEFGKDNSDLNTNFVVKNEIDQLHRFTLAGATNKMLAQQNSKTSVQLFPNPTPGQFTVLLNSAADTESAINLYDQLGRLLESRKVRFRAGVNNIAWNIAKYANGTYYLSFENTDLKTVRIVKE
jgi:hypothetical protein